VSHTQRESLFVEVFHRTETIPQPIQHVIIYNESVMREREREREREKERKREREKEREREREKERERERKKELKEALPQSGIERQVSELWCADKRR
jgi:hypothetical protein